MSTDSPAWRLRVVFVLTVLMIGATFFWLFESDPPDDAESNGAQPAPVEVADEERDDPDEEGDHADRTTTTPPNGVPSEMVGQWIQTRRIDVATGSAVDVVIGEALRLDIGADGTFTQQLGSDDVTEPQILRAIVDGNDLQVLVYADQEKLAENEHRLAADVAFEGDTMEWTFGEESTLVFDRE